MTLHCHVTNPVHKWWDPDTHQAYPTIHTFDKATQPFRVHQATTAILTPCAPLSCLVPWPQSRMWCLPTQRWVENSKPENLPRKPNQDEDVELCFIDLLEPTSMFTRVMLEKTFYLLKYVWQPIKVQYPLGCTFAERTYSHCRWAISLAWLLVRRLERNHSQSVPPSFCW